MVKLYFKTEGLKSEVNSMAKPIRIGKDDAEKILAELRRQLLGERSYGNVKIERSFGGTKERAKLIFTSTAWVKMQALVSAFATEVQWHGIVTRIEKNAWRIEDILNFPHTVSEATVVSDLTEYEAWEDSLDAETASKIRFHGHSHVNMAVTPSSVDLTVRDKRVSIMPEPSDDFDPYYIYMILNKRGEWSCSVYDITNNTLYETADIDIDVETADGSIESFVAEAKTLARPAPKVVTKPKAKTKSVEYRRYEGNNTSYYDNYSDYYSDRAGIYGGYNGYGSY